MCADSLPADNANNSLKCVNIWQSPLLSDPLTGIFSPFLSCSRTTSDATLPRPYEQPLFFFSRTQVQVFTCGFRCLECLKSTTFALLLFLGKALVVQRLPHTEPGSSFDVVCGHGYGKCGQRVRCVALRPRPSPGA